MLYGAGLALEWRFLDQNRGTDAFDDLAVMRFKGSCRADSVSSLRSASRGERIKDQPARRDNFVMAFTSVSDWTNTAVQRSGVRPQAEWTLSPG